MLSASQEDESFDSSGMLLEMHLMDCDIELELLISSTYMRP